jgi:hypothetical protein
LPFFAFEFSPRLYEDFGRNAKLLRNRDEIRLVRFQEPDQSGKQGRLSRPAAKLVCPDSGQIDEPLGPPRLTKRCRKRGKGKSDSIGWSRRRHA